jgi:hypothetical protein
MTLQEAQSTKEMIERAYPHFAPVIVQRENTWNGWVVELSTFKVQYT